MSDTTNAVKPCPYCEPYCGDQETTMLIKFEMGANTGLNNFENGIAIECLSCGLRGMAADDDEEQAEQIAVSFWNELYYEIKSAMAGFDMRQAQKQFFRRRRAATNEERFDLQQRAMKLEKDYDNILSHINLPGEEEQPRLI